MPENEKPTIAMLLDVEHISGEHEKRIAPFISAALLGALPILFYVYFDMSEFFPVWLFIPIELFILARVIMKIPGRERYRVDIFKRQLFDKYTAAADLMNIKMIHPDGCIEYTNGQICYLVCAFNGTALDEVQHSVMLRKFLQSLAGEYVFDIYIPNVNNMPALREYYNKVSNFERNESATNFIKIIDYNVQLVADNSLVQCTIYAIKGRRSDWKDIKKQIENTLSSQVAKVYKRVNLVGDPDVINEILDRNIDSVLNANELLRLKYANGDYDTSRVLVYDLDKDKEVVQGKKKVKSVLPPQTASGFHVKFEDDYNDDE